MLYSNPRRLLLWEMIGIQKEKLISSKMAGKVMEAIYNQNGFVLDSLTKTDFDNERIAKGVSVNVAHKNWRCGRI